MLAWQVRIPRETHVGYPSASTHLSHLRPADGRRRDIELNKSMESSYPNALKQLTRSVMRRVP